MTLVKKILLRKIVQITGRSVNTVQKVKRAFKEEYEN